MSSMLNMNNLVMIAFMMVAIGVSVACKHALRLAKRFEQNGGRLPAWASFIVNGRVAKAEPLIDASAEPLADEQVPESQPAKKRRRPRGQKNKKKNQAQKEAEVPQVIEELDAVAENVQEPAPVKTTADDTIAAVTAAVAALTVLSTDVRTAHACGNPTEDAQATAVPAASPMGASFMESFEGEFDSMPQLLEEDEDAWSFFGSKQEEADKKDAEKVTAAWNPLASRFYIDAEATPANSDCGASSTCDESLPTDTDSEDESHATSEVSCPPEHLVDADADDSAVSPEFFPDFKFRGIQQQNTIHNLLASSNVDFRQMLQAF